VQVRKAADAALSASGIWQNPYLEALSDGSMSMDVFRASQEQFYFAVAFFSRPMAGLVARSPDYASRIDILHNVVEEHGDFRLSRSHAATFDAFLTSLGSDIAKVHASR